MTSFTDLRYSHTQLRWRSGRLGRDVGIVYSIPDVSLCAPLHLGPSWLVAPPHMVLAHKGVGNTTIRGTFASSNLVTNFLLSS